MHHSSLHPPAPANDRETSRDQLPLHPANIGASAVRSGNNRRLTTDELAAELGMSAQSIRKRYSQTGSYFDLRPIKLPNRRLLWPANALEQLINR
ncbi:MAG TPA: hypothetical protein VJU59_34735 [Paraburkholderia sp.]|uniref:helix-turn-helix transcriptional regulator n=1 Tax=Paraburkholderia sp. TaxID=1926495 RepID=UPI002B4818DF|nr:hypothetical protein [Paraburkholderia sp.]HKR44775.1 hypothetical protein [Paraburkholderia sp.]